MTEVNKCDVITMTESVPQCAVSSAGVFSFVFKSSQVKSSQVKSSQVKSSQVKSSQVKLS